MQRLICAKCPSAFRNRYVFSLFLKLLALSDGSQRSSGHGTGDGEHLTAERAETTSWYDEMVAAGRSKSLTTGNIRCGVAAVHEVLGSPQSCLGDTGELSLRAYGGSAAERRASAAGSEICMCERNAENSSKPNTDPCMTSQSH